VGLSVYPYFARQRLAKQYPTVMNCLRHRSLYDPRRIEEESVYPFPYATVS
jgi:hypothetical protein